MSDYYDRQGKPLELMEWARLFEDWEYKRVAKDDLPGGVHVSTVWLGMNHSFVLGPPLIFETMVFPGEDCERYTTEAEALAGHARIVAQQTAQHPTERLS